MCARDDASGHALDACSQTLPECPYKPPSETKHTLQDLVDMAYVVSFQRSPKIVNTLEAMLGSGKVNLFQAVNGTDLEPYGGLTSGERGLLASTLRVFEDALQKNYDVILVLDDDALIANGFEHKFEKLLVDSSCSCFVDKAGSCPAGVLMLGSTVIGNEYIFDTWDFESKSKQRACVNFVPGVWGSFANIYNVKLLPEMIKWIKSRHPLPLDAVYTHLAMKGFIVRAAYPFLSMALMNKTSLVQSRENQSRFFESVNDLAEWYYRANRWNLEEFS